MRRFLRALSIAFALAVLVSGSVAFAAAPGRPSTTDAWPEFQLGASHTSVSGDTPINTQTAGALGINWMAPLRAADLGSPVAAYNSKLGMTVVYVGDERGDVLAFNESTGASIWSTSVGTGDAMRATPMIAPDGTVWVSTAYGPTVYKLDGTTGKILCGVKQKYAMNSSPMYAVPPHGVPTVYVATNDVGETIYGIMSAINESNCKTIWQFNKWKVPSGVWASAAYAVDGAGEPLVFIGTSDPDFKEYALDAKTGKLVWVYPPVQPQGDYDIGAGSTVSPPGNNGFKDGVLYFPSKYGTLIALDLLTGSKIWMTPFRGLEQPGETGRSATAFTGTTLYFGASDGLWAANAVSGQLLWHYLDPTLTESLSGPAVMGPIGSQVVGFADLSGEVHVLDASNGSDLYDYQTGNYVTSSPAIVNGHMLIDSADGFLYDFTVGGGNTAPGTTAIAFPSNGSTVPNPVGNLTVSGTSSDPAGIKGVIVSVQQGGLSGPWWDAATNSWSSGAIDNFVAAASPGQPNSNWSFQFPVPSSGSTYQVLANTVDEVGQVDRTGSTSSFTVSPNAAAPQLVTSSQFAPPGGSFTVSGTGFGPSETVSFTLQNHNAGSAATGPTGNFAATTVNVAAGDSFGLSTFVATGETSKLKSTTSIDVTNAWADAGYSASRTSFEPNDPTFTQTLEPSKKGYLSLSWLYASTAPIDASPAIVDGVGYVGNDAGALAALDTASGAPLWTYTTPSGAPIHGSPAVDGGYVFFGSDDATLYALDNTTGTLLGTTTLDGVPTAPAVAGGSVFIATDNGSVFDISEATGTIVWQSSVGAAIHSAPSVDIANSIVAVGDDSGHVTELSTADGSTVLTHTTGAAVTAPVAIQGGNIFIGSTDGTFYAYNEKTGSPVAKFKAGAPIHAFAVYGANAYIGDDAGSLSLIGSTTGKAAYTISIGDGALYGVSAAQGVPFAETTNGEFVVIKDSPLHVVYTYKTAGGLTTTAAVVDGAAFVGAEDTTVTAFTPYGSAPIDAKEHRLFMQPHKDAAQAAHWVARPAPLRFAQSAYAFAPSGPREFPLLVERPGISAASTPKRASAAQHTPRTYAIYWSPGRAASPLRPAGLPATIRGAAVDRAPFPAVFDDAAVQREIAREIAANRWHVDGDTQVIVVGERAAGMRTAPYCAYRSAFDLGGSLATPVAYAFAPAGAAAPCGGLTAVVARMQSEMRLDPLLGQ
jgi:outer membrane protein assembly factor BamB